MSTQEALMNGPTSRKPVFSSAAEPVLLEPMGCPFSTGFNMGAVDQRERAPHFFHQASSKAVDIEGATVKDAEIEVIEAPPNVPLGVLEHFKGTFVGTGFNMIFRPRNPVTKANDKLQIKTNVPAERDDNILELNLISERLKFKPVLGDVPNRGLFDQPDISLNGVPYLQRINDVANDSTGLADGKPIGIHVEPGLWMHVPATKIPDQAATLSRMASIPHGTAINAQGLDPGKGPSKGAVFDGLVVQGGPRFAEINTSPFIINQPNQRIFFPSMNAEDQTTPRIPQNLEKFIKSGLITTEIIKNPNLVLEKANKGKRFVETIVFTVSTKQRTVGEGITNIDFLEGHSSPEHKANADASFLEATFWIEKVKHQIEVRPWKKGDGPMYLTPIDTAPGVLAPRFKLEPEAEITTAKIIEVTATHIQYSQTVFLDFFGLTWPHVSVATLIPDTTKDDNAIPVPNSALL